MYRKYKSLQSPAAHDCSATSGRKAETISNAVERHATESGKSWRDILGVVASMEPWSEEPAREEREPWRDYIQQALSLVNSPRRSLPEVRL